MDTRSPHVGVSRRRFLAGAGLAGASLAGTGSLASVLSACGLNSGDTTSKLAPRGTKPKGNVLLLYFGIDQITLQAFQELFKVFNQQYPDVKLEARGIASTDWGSYFNTVSTQIAGGDVPDVVQVATEGQRLFASKGLAMPIDEYVARDKEDLAGFFDDVDANLIKQVNKYEKHGGNTYYLPGAFNTMAMWCNLDLFHKAGVPEPVNGWTWDDFLSASRKIAQLPGVYPYAARTGGAEYFTGIQPWLLTNSASTMNDDWTKATMTTPKAIEAVQFCRQLVTEKLMPGPGGQFDMFGAMAQGKVAMFGGGRWPVLNMRQLNFIKQIKIVSWPKKTVKGTPVGWGSFPIMKASKNKEAAWAFVKFMTSKQADTLFAQAGGTGVPVRRSVARSDSFLGNAPDGSLELYDALSYATPIPSPNRNNEIELAVIDELKQILAGNETVQDGCQKLNQKIQSTMA